jgi:hypothetical protein
VGTNHDGHGLLWVGGINIFPDRLETFMLDMVHCTNQFFIPLWWSVCTEAFLLGAKLDASSVTINDVGYHDSKF